GGRIRARRRDRGRQVEPALHRQRVDRREIDDHLGDPVRRPYLNAHRSPPAPLPRSNPDPSSVLVVRTTKTDGKSARTVAPAGLSAVSGAITPEIADKAPHLRVP